MFSVVVKGDKDLYSRFQRNVTPMLSKIVGDVGDELQTRMRKYPPLGPGNSPNARGRWYERGYGQRWFTAAGTMGGRATSEQMGTRWSLTKNGLNATLRNSASYSGWVQGEGTQARAHQGRWKTAPMVVEEMAGDGAIARIVREVISQY